MPHKSRVTAIIRRADHILLIHRKREGNEYWVLPGGGVETGEDSEQALLREVLEETGLGVNHYRFLFEQTEPDLRRNRLYMCEVEEGEPKLGGPELVETSATNSYVLEWVDMANFISMDPASIYPDPSRLFRLMAEKFI
jgi:8-oxo-dGTP pyrophosphatase MutT (NUDIX family)